MKLVKPRPKITWEGNPKDGLVGHRLDWNEEQLDAKVIPGPMKYRIKPKMSDFLKLIELEDAMAELKKFTAIDDRGKIESAKARYNRALGRFQSVRMGERIAEAIR